MKKLIMLAIATVSTACMVGCDKELPSPEKINAFSTVIGKTAGYASEIAGLKPNVKESIMTVLDIVSKVVPTNGQTFAEAWSPVIDEELQKLVAAGKINEASASIAKVALDVACDGIDYVFIKYPKAKDVKELVSAAVGGFVDGYKSVVSFAAGEAVPGIDEDAYKYLKEKLSQKK